MDAPSGGTSRGRRIAIRLLKGFAFGIVVPLLVGLAAAFVPAVQERLVRLGLHEVNASIAGRVELSSLRVWPDGRIHATGLRLLDPSGKPAASLDELTGRLEVFALLHRRIEIAQASLTHPVFSWVITPSGSTLVEALALRKPTPAPTPAASSPSAPSSWTIAVDQLQLANGQVAVVPPSGTGLAIDAIQLSAAFRDGPGQVLAQLHVTGAMHQPEEAPVNIDVQIDGTGLPPDGHLALRQLTASLGSSSVAVAGAEQSGVLVLDLTGTLRAVLAQSLGVPLVRDLPLEAHGTWDGATANVTASLGGANPPVTATGTLHPQTAATPTTVGVDLHHLNPHDWVEGVPAGDLTGHLAADSKLSSGQPFEADLRAEIEASEMAGVRFGPVRGDARLAGDQIEIQELTATAPGATVRVSGTASAAALKLTAVANVDSLEKLTEMLGVAGWSGAGQATASVTGAMRNPYVNVEARFAHLVGPSLQLENLSVRADGRPLLAKPQLTGTLHADRGVVGTRPVSELDGEVTIDPSEFQADLRTRRSPVLLLKVEGRFPGPSQVALDHLELTLEPYRWILEESTLLDLRHGFHTPGLRLRSGEQVIVVRGGLEGDQLSAELQLTKVRLDQIPSLFAPPGSALKGQVSGDVQASGTIRQPQIEASLDAQSLGFRGIQVSTLAVKAGLSHGRVQTSASLVSPAGTVSASMSSTLRDLQRGKLSATVHAQKIDLPKLSEMLAPSLPPGAVPMVAGTAGLDAEVSGSLASPDATLRVTLDKVATRGSPPLSGQVTAKLDTHAAVALDLHSGRLAIAGRGEIETPPGLLTSADASARIQHEPLTGDIKATGFYGEDWRQLLGLPLDAAGELDAEIEGKGTLADPTGTLTATSANGLTLSGYHVNQARVSLAVDSRRVQATCDLAGAGNSTLHTEAALEAGIRRLIAKENLGQVAVRIKAHADGHLEGLAIRKGAQGHLTLGIDAKGTLGEPVVHAEVRADGLKLSQTPMPQTRVQADYEAGHAHLDAHAPNLDLTATLNQAFGYSVALPTDPTAIPFQLQVRAVGYDLSAYAGITPELETVEGFLDADVQASGTAAAPEVTGKVALTKGRVVWAGVGDFQQIDLHSQFSPTELAVTNLDLHAGDGKLHLEARAKRKASGPYSVTGKFTVEKFPILYEDQLLVLAGAQSTISGNLSYDDSLIEVHFKSVHMDVPSLSHRTLESLDPNPNITIVRSGTALAFVATPPVASKPAMPATKTSSAHPPSHTRIRLEAPANFWVKGSDMDLDLRADVGLQLDDGLEIIDPPGTSEPSMVELVRGHLAVFGRRFDVPDARPSKLTFEGGDPSLANLDVQLLYVDDVDNVTVTLAVTGPVTHPDAPVMTSVPALDASTIAMLIATGHLDTKRGSGGFSPSNEAASVLGSLIAGQVQKTLSAHLPVDTLTLTTSDQGVKVEAGVYLTSISDRLYLGYTHNVITGTETDIVNINEVNIQYQLSRHWELRATGGDAAKGGFDAMWTKDY